MSSDNIFVKIAKHEIPAQIIYEDDRVVAFKDINPQAPVHFLVIPRTDLIATLNDLKPEHNELIGHMFLTAQKLANQLGIADDGYRCVINCNEGAGQSVFQLHLHVLGGRPMAWPPG